MLLEEGRISRFQLTMLMVGFIYGTSVIVSPARSAGHDGWIASLIGVMEALLIAWVFCVLVNQFKDKTLIEINDLVYGRMLGKVISLIFIWYLFHLSALVLNVFGRFFATEIYLATPKTVILIIIVAVCASTVGRGIEVLARCSMVLVLLTLFIIINDAALAIPTMDIKNLLPILDIPVGKLLWAAHGAAAFPFAETVAFTMIFAFSNNHKGRYAPVATAILIGGLSLTLLVARNSLVLGPMESAYEYPTYMAIQMIDIGDILSRGEVVVAVFFIFTGFLKLSVLLYGTVLGLSQVFNLRSYRPLIIPIGILMIILALTNVGSSIELYSFINKEFPIYIMPWELGIPLITLIVAKLRKLPQTGGETA
ncbi:MAG TPA: endospore germination permease [Syntrophomonadaceae bacterium]|nr:endospore germination permease [Syntrophomonadaceae bacterium]